MVYLMATCTSVASASFALINKPGEVVYLFDSYDATRRRQYIHYIVKSVRNLVHVDDTITKNYVQFLCSTVPLVTRPNELQATSFNVCYNKLDPTANLSRAVQRST